MDLNKSIDNRSSFNEDEAHKRFKGKNNDTDYLTLDH